jgi:hypothetical protein
MSAKKILKARNALRIAPCFTSSSPSVREKVFAAIDTLFVLRPLFFGYCQSGRSSGSRFILLTGLPRGLPPSGSVGFRPGYSGGTAPELDSLLTGFPIKLIAPELYSFYIPQ